MTISTIDPATPDDDEPVGDGDNQIRALKQAIVNQFVGEAGDLWDTALTAGPRALNLIDDKVGSATFDALEARVSVNELAIVTQAATFVGHDARLDALEAIDHSIAQAQDACWPVGSVFISYDGASPSAKGLPGTWSRFADGRMLVGAASGYGANGGSNTVTLAKANIPAHQHKHVTVGDEFANPAPAPSYSGFTYNRHQGGSGVRWNEGTTENGVADGLKASPTAVNIQNAHVTVAFYRRTA